MEEYGGSGKGMGCDIVDVTSSKSRISKLATATVKLDCHFVIHQNELFNIGDQM